MSRDGLIELPPGFRFHPTDEEIISSYLREKYLDRNFNPRAIGVVDLNKCEPWDLPGRAKNIGEKEWYYFCQRDRKYPTGTRTNRATEAGYWKATGKDKEIFDGNNNLIGMKKTLVFYRGRAPRGEKTSWVIHEYRLENSAYGRLASRVDRVYDEWVVCRVTHKHTDEMSGTNISSTSSSSSSSSMTIGLPHLMDTSYPNASASRGDDLMLGSSSSIPMMNNHPYHNPQYYNLPPNPMNSSSVAGCFIDPNEVAEMGGHRPGAGAADTITTQGGVEAASKICKEEECSTQSHPTSSSTAISNEMRDVPPEIGIERSTFDELDELLSSAGSLGNIDNFWDWC